MGLILSRTVFIDALSINSGTITPHETLLDHCFDPNSIELCIFCELYFDVVLSPVFKYKVLVGVLSSSI